MIVVNFYAGPGTGKSTSAAMVFAMLKQRGINAEYVPEFAKDLTWHERMKTLSDQVYILGKQQHKLYMLNGEVDVVVTDAPMLTGLYYGKDTYKSLSPLILEIYNSYDNIDIFLNRTKPYNPKGRNQTEVEARHIDSEIRKILDKHTKNGYYVFETDMASYEKIIDMILAWRPAKNEE